MLYKKLFNLRKYFKKNGFDIEYAIVDRIIKVCSLPGIDAPTDEQDIIGVENAMQYARETALDNEGEFIYLDNPEGSKKRFGQKLRKLMTFHYGEFTRLNNPADDMGWDVIVVPSSSEVSEVEVDEDGEEISYIPSGHNLVPVGYVPVEDDQDKWTRETRSEGLPEGKKAPVGNDKIILAPNGIYTESDVKVIEDFFEPLWNFKSVEWLKEWSPKPNK